MYTVSETARKNNERILGLSLSELQKLSPDEEMSYIEHKIGKKLTVPTILKPRFNTEAIINQRNKKYIGIWLRLWRSFFLYRHAGDWIVGQSNPEISRDVRWCLWCKCLRQWPLGTCHPRISRTDKCVIWFCESIQGSNSALYALNLELYQLWIKVA